jgi:hypothetical protein
MKGLFNEWRAIVIILDRRVFDGLVGRNYDRALVISLCKAGRQRRNRPCIGRFSRGKQKLRVLPNSSYRTLVGTLLMTPTCCW